jgi:hypothetical protein
MSKFVVGLYSPAPQSGKTLAANVLAHSGFQPISFAEPLKKMIAEFLVSIGYEKDDAVRLAWVDKAIVLPEINASCRYLLQTIGTQWGRNYVCEDIWIKSWKIRASKFHMVVTDDVRFENEAQAIKEVGGQVWKIVRPSATHDWSHVSEGGLDNWDGFDCIIENTGSIEELRDKIDLAIKNAW